MEANLEIYTRSGKDLWASFNIVSKHYLSNEQNTVHNCLPHKVVPPTNSIDK